LPGDFVVKIVALTSGTECSLDVELPSKRSPDGVMESLKEGKLMSLGGDSIPKLEVSFFEEGHFNNLCFFLPDKFFNRICDINYGRL
jgi:hypothetical protein